MPTNRSKTEDLKAPRPPELTAIGLPIAVGSVAVQASADMGAEVVRFIRDRLQQDIETQRAMLACTSLDEMRKIQTEYFTAAQKQYAAEAAKMLNLMGKAASGLTASAKVRRYDDVPL